MQEISNKKASEQYKNAPLAEAIFEIQFPAEPAIECNRNLFYEKIRPLYPDVFVPQVNSGNIPSLDLYRFMDEDNISGFFVSINSIAYSTKKYPGF